VNNEQLSKIIGIINDFMRETKKQSDTFHKSFLYWLNDYAKTLNERLDPIIQEVLAREQWHNQVMPAEPPPEDRSAAAE
jgi:hypothetical protein